MPWLKKLEETDDSDAGADLLTFSVESSSEFPRQDDWLVMLKIAGTNVNFKLDFDADFNKISTLLLLFVRAPPPCPVIKFIKHHYWTNFFFYYLSKSKYELQISFTLR